MIRWRRSAGVRTRVWLGVAPLSDGDPQPGPAAVALETTIKAIEGRGGTVVSIAASPFALPGGNAVLLTIIYRETTGLDRVA